jgi:hypothetical protein
VRPPVDTIPAPPFPAGLDWINGRPPDAPKALLVEFWDFCRVHSVRTLPYVRGWHERYADSGLAVVGVHCPGFPPSRDEDAVRAAVARLEIAYPVCTDHAFDVWQLYDNPGWPARYLFDEGAMLRELHHGEGGYRETELAIQELLGVQREPMAPLRPEEDPEALIAAPSEDQGGAWSGAYEAGAVWAVVSGGGTLRVNGVQRTVAWPGCHLLVDHGRHTAAVLELEVGEGVTCHAVCFTPGIC